MTDPIQSAVSAASPAQLSDVERKKVAELAHQFESMLMTQMLREMRKSMLTEEESEGGFGASAMSDTVDVELGNALSRSSGLGLSDMLIKAFDRRAGAHPPPAASAVPAALPEALPAAVAADTTIPAATRGTAAAPVQPPSAPAAGVGEPAPPSTNPTLPEGRITSTYGWRSDPFTGQTRFHSGTDVKMAYGQEVHSAAGGRVAFVGEQSGYGLTVAIDHGNGITTRYAHLSETTVRAGDAVGSGQVVARSGNSGR